MSLSALPTALLLPPANLVPLGLVGLLLGRRWPRLGRFLTALALLALLLLSLPATSMLLMATLQAGISRDVPTAADGAGAIVILSAEGGGGGVGGILPSNGVGPMTLERMHAGVILARRLDLPLLVTGGPSTRDAPPIAIEMARTLEQDFARPARWIEARAADTWENAAYSAAILSGASVRRVIIVTNAWHMRRAMQAFRHFGIEAIPAASRFEPYPKWEFEDFVPRVTSWLRSYHAIHEWVGCAYYALRR